MDMPDVIYADMDFIDNYGLRQNETGDFKWISADISISKTDHEIDKALALSALNKQHKAELEASEANAVYISDPIEYDNNRATAIIKCISQVLVDWRDSK